MSKLTPIAQQIIVRTLLETLAYDRCEFILRIQERGLATEEALTLWCNILGIEYAHCLNIIKRQKDA